jgi:hypothetical protein
MKPTQEIIDELRKEADHPPCPARMAKLLTEAADRIEYLFASGIHTCHDQCQRPMCVLRRERDKAHADLARVTAERDNARAQALADRAFQSDNAALRARVADLEAAASLHWITDEELKQARLARDNAKTCEAIHFGAVRWPERYVKVLKIELHRQELANLRKKRTIRGLRKERSKMRALVKEACEGQAAKINALEALP